MEAVSGMVILYIHFIAISCLRILDVGPSYELGHK